MFNFSPVLREVTSSVSLIFFLSDPGSGLMRPMKEIFTFSS
jgi:hypothetical protein